MRVFLKISYDGSAYHGWQVQPNDISVQQVIEEALSRLQRKPTPIVGAGRTDAGVNARILYAHCDIDDDSLAVDIAKKSRLLASLNALTPRDIAIHDIIPVADDAHARFDATSRTYRYFVHHGRDPFNERYSLPIKTLDYEAMNRAAELLLATDDFTSFAKLHSDARTNICHVTSARWFAAMPCNAGDTGVAGFPCAPGIEHWCFEISADRFLRNMVRAIVGTLVEVGRGKMSLEQFQAVIDGRNRCIAGTSMPPHPLFLWDVTYPYID